MATITTVPASEIESALTAALKRLVDKDVARRGFVVVRHEPTSRFFQYGLEVGTRRLFYDVPQLGVVAESCSLPEGLAFGVHLVECWRLAPNEPLTLTEDDSESGRRRLVRKTKEWLEELREKLAPGLPALPGVT